MDPTTVQHIFDSYYRDLQQREQAVLPDERLAILDRMEAALLQQGILPIDVGEIAQFNIHHPTYAAILRGDDVAIGGTAVAARPQKGVQSLPLPARLGLLLLIFLLPVALFTGLIVVRSRGETAAAPPQLETGVKVTETAVFAETAVPTFTPLPPTLPPPVVITVTPGGPTPTPLPITALRGSVAAQGSDPASVEVGGESFILAVGTTQNGIWLPQGAEWLEGTVLRRVIAIPYQPELMPKLEQLEGDVRLRLRSGAVVSYRVTSVAHYRRDQIEVLAGTRPSVAIVVYGAAGDERLVLVGESAEGGDAE